MQRCARSLRETACTSGRTLHKVTRSSDQKDVKSNMRNTPRLTAGVLERLVAHRRAAQ